MLKTPQTIVPIIPQSTKTRANKLQVLDVYVDRIRQWTSQPQPVDSIPFDSYEVPVSAWAARAAERYCSGPAEEATRLDRLVVQSIAVVAKCHQDAATPSDGTDLRQVYARQAETMLSVAVGSVVLKDLQTVGNELLAAGQNDNLRALNQIQHETRTAVMRARGLLSENERRKAKEFMTAFGDVPDTPEPEPATPSPVPRLTTEQRRVYVPAPATDAAPKPNRKSRPRFEVTERSAPSRSSPAHVMLRVVLLLVVIALIGVGFNSRSVAPVKGDASISLVEAMTEEPGVTEVQDRMPYVILTVRPNFWSGSNDGKRRDWVKGLSRTVARHGYSGLVVRSTSGHPLAEWVQDRGVKFAGEDEPAAR